MFMQFSYGRYLHDNYKKKKKKKNKKKTVLLGWSLTAQSTILRSVYLTTFSWAGLVLCQTGWTYRLIGVFAGYTGLIVGFVVRWLS